MVFVAIFSRSMSLSVILSIRATVSSLGLKIKKKQSWRRHIKYMLMGPEDCWCKLLRLCTRRKWPAVKWNDKGQMSGTELRGGTNCFVVAWFTPWSLSVLMVQGYFRPRLYTDGPSQLARSEDKEPVYIYTTATELLVLVTKSPVVAAEI